MTKPKGYTTPGTQPDTSSHEQHGQGGQEPLSGSKKVKNRNRNHNHHNNPQGG